MRVSPRGERHHSAEDPHWSVGVEWRAGRWDPISNAPSEGEWMAVRGRDKAGNVLEPLAFVRRSRRVGWFVGDVRVYPVEWQPLHAEPAEPPPWPFPSPRPRHPEAQAFVAMVEAMMPELAQHRPTSP